MVSFPSQERQQKRIALLYLIYRDSWADTNFSVSLAHIQHGTDRLFGKPPAYLSKVARYLIGENWIYQRSDYEDIVFITHLGIKQTEQWEQDYSLEQRIEIDLLHEESMSEIRKEIADRLDTKEEYVHLGRPRYLINWDKTILDDYHKKTNNIALSKGIENSFDKKDLKALCFELNVEWENLSGETKQEKIRELITYFANRNRIDELIREIEDLRPNIDWKRID